MTKDFRNHVAHPFPVTGPLDHLQKCPDDPKGEKHLENLLVEKIHKRIFMNS